MKKFDFIKVNIKTILYIAILFLFGCSKDNDVVVDPIVPQKFVFPLTDKSEWIYIPIVINSTPPDTSPNENVQKLVISGDTTIKGTIYKLNWKSTYNAETYPSDNSFLVRGRDTDALIRSSDDSIIMRSWNSDYVLGGCSISENEFLLFKWNADIDQPILDTAEFYNHCYCDSSTYIITKKSALRTFSNSFHSFSEVFKFELYLVNDLTLDTNYFAKFWIANRIGIVRKQTSCHPDLYLDLSSWNIEI